MRLQTEAKLAIQESIRSGELQLVWSAMLDLENTNNPDPQRSVAVGVWKSLASVDVSTSDDVEQTASLLEIMGLKSMDALHVASAMEADAQYFLTTDNGILRKMKNDHRIAVVDPIEFVRQCENDIVEGQPDEE